jgi:hypothetical protein
MITGVKLARSCDSFATETLFAALLTRLEGRGFNAFQDARRRSFLKET